ncbi:MAG: hypothetical protein VKI83_01750 [Synechococcaceae cyanobacterium]|nr:hypothetical protein [Synechococcaceae cyanobacterium]
MNALIGDPLPGLGLSLYDLFNEDRLLAPFDASKSALGQGCQGSMGAHNGVSLFRLGYDTVVPETGRQETVSGLLALPDLEGLAGRTLPLLSWQHGTIFEAADAPSQLCEGGTVQRDGLGVPRSAETLFNVVRFAGNGFVVSAADYLGNGLSRATQAYAVKGATVQTLLHQLAAARAVLQQRGLKTGPLFLNGWSQGGLNSQWFGWALQERGVPVSALAAVSAPTDLPMLVGYWMNNFPGSPNWLTAAMPLLFGSYETYYGLTDYGLKDLMAEAIRPQYLTIAREIYAKTYDWAHVDWTSPNPICRPNSLEEPRICLPVLARQMLNPDFLAACNHGDHPFMQRIRANTALQGRYAMPCRFYGGSGDAVVPGWSSMLLPVEHQQRLGSTLAGAVPVTMGDTHTPAGAPRPGGTHRSSFLASLFDPGLSVQRWCAAACA